MVPLRFSQLSVHSMISSLQLEKLKFLQFISWWNCENGVTDPEDCQGVERPNDEIMRRIEEWPAHGKN